MKKPFSDGLIEEIRTRADIVSLISEDLILKKKGKNYVGLCPFHGEKTPSFTVSPEKQIFYCFGCGAGGDVFSYLMKQKNMGFADSVKTLAQRSGVSLPEEIESPEEKRKFKEKERIFHINQMAAKYYRKLFEQSEAGRQAAEYLSARGIAKETMELFFLGTAPPQWDGLLKAMGKEGVAPEELEKAGLVLARKDKSGHYDRFRHRLMFPIVDLSKRVTGFGGRVLDDSEPKYLNSPETPVFDKSKNMYGITLAQQAIREKDQVLLVEGYMDVIALHQAGVKNTVATLGTALGPSHGKILSRFGADLVICYDGDSSGQAAAVRGAEQLTKVGCSVRIARLPGEEDPDSYIRKTGKEAFLKRVEQAQSLTAFQIQEVLSQMDQDSAQGQADIIKRVIPILAKIDSVSEREAHLGALAKKVGIRETAIRTDVLKYKRERKSNQDGSTASASAVTAAQKAPDKQLLPAHIRAEQDILRLMVKSSEAWLEVKEGLSPDDFSQSAYQSTARACWDLDEKGKKLTTASVLDWLKRNDEKAFEVAAGLFVKEDDQDGQPSVIVQDYMKAIKRRRRKEQLRVLHEQIVEWEAKKEPSKVEKLLLAYQQMLQDGHKR